MMPPQYFIGLNAVTSDTVEIYGLIMSPQTHDECMQISKQERTNRGETRGASWAQKSLPMNSISMYKVYIEFCLPQSLLFSTK